MGKLKKYNTLNNSALLALFSARLSSLCSMRIFYLSTNLYENLKTCQHRKLSFNLTLF